MIQKFQFPIEVVHNSLGKKLTGTTFKPAVEKMAKPFHFWLKNIFRNLSTQTAIWVYLKRHLKKWVKANYHTIYCKYKKSTCEANIRLTLVIQIWTCADL